MAIEGSLSDVGLADISQLLALGRKTGCLTLTDRSNFGYIYFQNGRVIYASVLNRPDRLGDMLVKNGIIEPEDLEQAMAEQARDSQKRLGEILVELDAVSEDVLETWVSRQVEEAVYHLFGWDSGTFHFNPGERPEKGEVLLVSLSADNLLLEGARRVDEWSLIEEKIHSLDLLFRVTRDPREDPDVDLSAIQRKVLPLLDGTRSVRDVVEESGTVEFEAGKAIYELAKAGFVQAVGEKSPEGIARGEELLQDKVALGHAFYRAGMLEDAAAEYRKALEVDPDHSVSLFRLASVAIREGDPETALSYLDRLPRDWTSQAGVARNRALALESLARFEEAVESLEVARKENPHDWDLVLAKGIAQLRGGRFSDARKTFNRYRHLLGRRGAPPIYYAHAVLGAAGAGYLNEAVSLGREGLKQFPNHAAILVNTGAILDHRGDHEAAEQYFLRALNTGSEGPPQAYKNLGNQAFRRGDLSTARSHFEDAVRLDPALGDDVFLKLGIIAQEDSDSELALLFFQRAMELNPENQDVQARLAQLSSAV